MNKKESALLPSLLPILDPKAYINGIALYRWRMEQMEKQMEKCRKSFQNLKKP